MQVHIGIDDTDSKNGGCTTYIAACLVEKLLTEKWTFTDYPNIIRLNPNIPYKTRGNAAVALRIRGSHERYSELKEIVLEAVEKSSKLGSRGTDPAVVFAKGTVPLAFKKLARKALWSVVDCNQAIDAVRTVGADAFGYGSNLGLVGATAAIGESLNADHTYELIAYRKKRNRGRPRRVDTDSVVRMDKVTAPSTFNNYDYVNKRVLVAPHGPDPVLLGIRGETAEATLLAFRKLQINEPVERWVIFRTNHGTDSHFVNAPRNRQITFNEAIVVIGEVAEAPVRIRGGHVFFPLRYNEGTIQCAAFEPTGTFRDSVALLVEGDVVEAYGGVRRTTSSKTPTINLEKLVVRQLGTSLILQNPICPNCDARMKSAGKTQGFRCDRCGLRLTGKEKERVRVPRRVAPGIYIPVSKAHRHLTKPLIRYGREKIRWDGCPPAGEWHYP